MLAGVFYTYFLSFFLVAIVVDQHFITSKTIILCYYMDNEMFIADQRYVEPFLEDYMHLFSNISKGGKQINVETYLPEKMPETNQTYFDPNKEALSHQKVVTETSVSNQTVLASVTETTRTKRYDAYGKPMTKSKKVGFIGNSMFNVEQH